MTTYTQFKQQKNFFIKNYALSLKSIMKTVIKGIRLNNNDLEIKTTPNNLRGLLFFLQRHTLCQYTQLVDLACLDVPGKKRRFMIHYLLLSLRYNARLKIVLQTNEVSPLPSVITLYRSANWLEREVWDLYGVFFDLHSDLRRILTDYGFSGHPLRKDFPLTGFLEVYYNDSTKRLSYEAVELAQEYRTFTLQSPWNQNEKKIEKATVLPSTPKALALGISLGPFAEMHVALMSAILKNLWTWFVSKPPELASPEETSPQNSESSANFENSGTSENAGNPEDPEMDLFKKKCEKAKADKKAAKKKNAQKNLDDKNETAQRIEKEKKAALEKGNRNTEALIIQEFEQKQAFENRAHDAQLKKRNFEADQRFQTTITFLTMSRIKDMYQNWERDIEDVKKKDEKRKRRIEENRKRLDLAAENEERENNLKLDLAISEEQQEYNKKKLQADLMRQENDRQRKQALDMTEADILANLDEHRKVTHNFQKESANQQIKSHEESRDVNWSFYEKKETGINLHKDQKIKKTTIHRDNAIFERQQSEDERHQEIQKISTKFAEQNAQIEKDIQDDGDDENQS